MAASSQVDKALSFENLKKLPVTEPFFTAKDFMTDVFLRTFSKFQKLINSLKFDETIPKFTFKRNLICVT